MFKNFSATLICLLVVCYALATPETPFRSSESKDECTECTIPAPINFHVTDAGSTWVTLTWSPAVPDNSSFRIKTFLTNGNVLISDVVVTGQTTLTLQNLPANKSRYSRICAICPDGTDSKYFNIIDHPEGIITELIVTGYDGNTAQPTCGVRATGEYCEFPVTPNVDSYFKFRRVGMPLLNRKFATYRNPTSGVLRAKIDPADGDDLFKFRIDGQVPNEQGVPGTHFQIFSNDGHILLGVFQLYFHYNGDQTIGRLICESMHENYEIVRTSPPPNGMSQPNSGGAVLHESTTGHEEFVQTFNPSDHPQENIQDLSRSSNAQTLQTQAISAMPNPFSHSLEVSLAQPVAERGKLQLYSLSGQLLQTESLVPGAMNYAFSTAEILPGFYLLRVEVDGITQVLKIIKQ